jgi:DNA-binding response OmpR family regulator
MRLLWIGMAEGELSAEMNRWYISDFATDCSDAELFLMSRRYDAVLFAGSLPERRVQRLIGELGERRPHTLTVALGEAKPRWGERDFLGWGGALHVPFPQSRDAELLRLRIESFLLRSFSGETVQIGPLRVEPQCERVLFKDEAVSMQKGPFALFYHLLLKRHRILGKEELLCALHEHPEYTSESSIEYAVCAIREQLDRRFGEAFIKTLRNRGYRFVYNA